MRLAAALYTPRRLRLATIRRRLVLLTLISMGAGYFADEFIPATLPLLVSELGFTRTQAGICYSIAYVASPLTTLLAGMAARRLEEAAVLCALLMLAGQACTQLAATVHAGSFVLVLLSRLLFGLGFEPREVVSEMLLSKRLLATPPVSRSMAFGWFSAANEAGALLGALLLTASAHSLGLGATSVWPVLALAIGAAACCLLFWGRDEVAMEVAHDGGKRAAGGAQGAIAELRSACLSFGKEHWLTMGVTSVGHVAVLSFQVFLVDALHSEWEMTLAVAGLHSAGLQVAAIIAAPIVGGLLERQPRAGAVVLAVGMSLQLTAYILLATRAWGAEVLGVALLGAACGAVATAGNTILSSAREEVYAVSCSMQSLMQIMCGPAIGALHATSGGYFAVLVAFGALSLIGLSCALLLEVIS